MNVFFQGLQLCPAWSSCDADHIHTLDCQLQTRLLVTFSRSPALASPSMVDGPHRGSISSSPLPQTKWCVLCLLHPRYIWVSWFLMSSWAENESTEALWKTELLGGGEGGTCLKSVSWLTRLSLEGMRSIQQSRTPKGPQATSRLLRVGVNTGFSKKAFDPQGWCYSVG